MNGNGNGSHTRGGEPERRGPLPFPQAVDSEKAVLGSMMLDPGLIPEVADRVAASDFYLPAHGEIYTAIKTLHAAGSPPDLMLVVDALKRAGKLDEVGGSLYLATLEQFVLATGAAPELADLVRTKSKRRQLMRLCGEIATKAATEANELEADLAAAQSGIIRISEGGSAGRPYSVGELWQPMIEDLERRSIDGHGTGLLTDFDDIDTHLEINPSSLTIIGARASIGKTAFALNVAYNIACSGQGRVLYCSLEMPKEQLCQRIACRHIQLDMALIKQPKYLSTKKRAELAEALAFAREIIAVDVDDRSLGLGQFETRGRAWISKVYAAGEVPAAIVVDYLGLMQIAHKRGGNRNEELGELSRAMKVFAMDNGVPIIALHQLNRDLEKREGTKAKPRLSDLRESGHLEEDADNVLFVHRNRDACKPPVDEALDGFRAPLIADAEILIAKNRNGGLADIPILFDLRTQTFLSKARRARP